MLSRRRFVCHSLGTLAGVSLLPPLWAQQPPAQGLTVATTAGRVQGLRIAGVEVFRGVPYGAPPVGARRFMPATPPPSWTGVREAAGFGLRAPQPPRAMIPEVGDALTGSGPTGEDCLNLNVWTTGISATPKPVVVWFHGGAYRSGSANSVFYDGTALATSHDVVVVTVNHRLNVLGFLDLSSVGDTRYASSGNVGLLDLVLALRWVRDNIAQFGGDPGNVTAMGQSGGGGKVSMLCGMPEARGLFHRAIIMSTLVESGVKGLTKEESRAATARLLGRLGLSPANIAPLHDVPVETLMAALPGASGIATGTAPGSGASDDISTTFYPVVDGLILPNHPFDPVAPAISANVPLLTGSDETEGIPYGDPGDPYWSSDIDTEAALRTRVKTVLRVDDADADRLISVYRRSHPSDSLADIAAIVTGDNSGSRMSSRLIAERKAAQGRAPAFHYYFKWRSPVRNGKLRSMHSMELPFVWNHPDRITFMTGMGPERAALATAMSGAFMSFARTGTPAVPGVAKWAPYDTARRGTMVFDTTTAFVDDPYGEVRQALDAIRDRRR